MSDTSKRKKRRTQKRGTARHQRQDQPHQTPDEAQPSTGPEGAPSLVAFDTVRRQEPITFGPLHTLIDAQPSRLTHLGNPAGFVGFGKPYEQEPITFIGRGSYDLEPIKFIGGGWSEPARVSYLDAATITQSRDLEKQINELRRQKDEQAAAYQAAKEGSKKKQAEIQRLQDTIADLRNKEQLRFLLERVNPTAQKELLRSAEFRARFLTSAELPAFAMSVDIRRSTELMLKARKPELFAAFITTLCTDLMTIITECFGVVDKFTGDGVLSFFPEFFSGPDAGYLVVTAAARCHEAFAHHYRGFRSSFSSVLSEVGLGIGVDHGMLHLVQMTGGLTVVGQPVVYACRLGSCPAGVTLLNQPAYDKVIEHFSSYLFIRETELEVKHEGKMLAYQVAPNRQTYEPKLPEWVTTDATDGSS